jgi:hypothetical protein
MSERRGDYRKYAERVYRHFDRIAERDVLRIIVDICDKAGVYYFRNYPNKLFETIRNEAIGLVGLGRYRFLLRAIALDWQVEDLSPNQCSLLIRLDYNQSRMLRAITLLSKRVIRKLRSEEDTDVQTSKINGVWVQNTEAPRHALA